MSCAILIVRWRKLRHGLEREKKMGYKVKPRQQDEGRVPKKFQQEVACNTTQKSRAKKKDRLRRPYEKTDEHEGWDL